MRINNFQVLDLLQATLFVFKKGVFNSFIGSGALAKERPLATSHLSHAHILVEKVGILLGRRDLVMKQLQSDGVVGFLNNQSCG